MSKVKDKVPEVKQPNVLVEGKSFDDIPADLYIPPDYLQVFLERFEGPLDLLLYLIRKRNFDLLNLPIIKITEQYLEYLEVMRRQDIDIASEYLVMAATLIQLKSRLLLPRKSNDFEAEEIDPRAELAARLLAYEKTQQAASYLDECERIDRDFLPFAVHISEKSFSKTYHCDKEQLMESYKNVLKQAQITLEHQVEPEQMTVQEGMLFVLEQIESRACYFHDIIPKMDSINGVICCFSGLLELAKQRVVRITQHEPLAEIFIQRIEQKEVIGESNALS